MEKKKIYNRTYAKYTGRQVKNPAQQLAKQRLQRDMQKKLLDTRKKAKEQTKQKEEEQSPEAAAITILEETAVNALWQTANTQIILPRYPAKSKTRFKKAPTRTPVNHTINPAMKQWGQRRMILQKQEMRINTKIKLERSSHVQVETIVEYPKPPRHAIHHVWAQPIRSPENQYAPNIAWAHTVIQKKQVEFREKYWTSKTNPKKEIPKGELIQNNFSPVKRIAYVPIVVDDTQPAPAYARSSVAIRVQQEAVASLPPPTSHISQSAAVPTSPPYSPAVSIPKQIQRQHTDYSVQRTPPPAAAYHRTPIQPPKHPQTHAQAPQHHKQSSLHYRQQQARFIQSWQAKQKQDMVRSGMTRGSRTVWQKVKVIAEHARIAISHSGAWIVLLFLLLLLLFLGAVGDLVSSPFGVFFSSQETSPEARSVRAAIAETNNEYFNELDGLIRNTKHDTLVIHQIPSQQANDTQIHNWEEILAVFAVQTTTDGQSAMDVVKLDDKRIEKLKDIFWQMVSIEHKTETIGKGDSKKITLTITITTKSAEQMENELHFSKVQKGALDELLANRAWLTELIGQATGSGSGHGGGEYQIPPEALADEKFKAMITEAEKYLGFPYVWGGSSPSTSFDCSGFVSWVINKSGVGNVGRETAQGLYNRCVPISKAQAKPGDLVFFTKTYSTSNPVTHVGIFVGDNKMIHCGNVRPAGRK